MKPLLNIILSIIVFGASFQNSLFMIDYKINQDFYEIHCINKAKPEMDCHGKCQVQEEINQSSNPFNLVKYSFEFNILPTPPISFFDKKENDAFLSTFNFNYQDVFFLEIVIGILPHPPQV